MAVTGAWINRIIEDGLAQRAANETLLTLNDVIGPFVQSLAGSPAIPPEAQGALTEAFAETASRDDFTVVRIWSTERTVVYSNRPRLLEHVAPDAQEMRQAFGGLVVAGLDRFAAEVAAPGLLGTQSWLKVVAPLRATGTRRVIGVVEYYGRHGALEDALQRIRWQTYLGLASLTIAIMAALLIAVIRPSHAALAAADRGLDKLSGQNEALREKLGSAGQRLTSVNEGLMRRVSAELHDVPVQLIAFALLRLDALRPRQQDLLSAEPTNDGLQLADGITIFNTIHDALLELLTEIRHISAGLATPELAGLSLAEVLDVAAVRHQERTGTKVVCDLAELPDPKSPELKLCVYRFAQEGLNNAVKHAGGREQTLHAHLDGSLLDVTISDKGPGFTDVRHALGAPGRLGLSGLRARVEALGGTFEIRSQPGRGTRLTARFNLSDMGLMHA